MEARVPRCTHAASSVPCYVTCCDSQTISEASKHQTLREWTSSSCYARISEIYLYGGICKKPQVAITLVYRYQPWARAPIDAGVVVADNGKVSDYRY